LIERAEQVVALAERLSSAELIALDVESNGLHAYKPILCTMQLALVHGGEVSEIAIEASTLPLPLGSVDVLA
jgi:ribonuclease D